MRRRAPIAIAAMCSSSNVEGSAGFVPSQTRRGLGNARRHLAATALRTSAGQSDDADLLSNWLAQSSSPAQYSEWYTETDSNLPFDCTGCGNCCKTKGDVLLSPDETRSAASLLDLSVDEFKKRYVAEEEVTVLMSLDPERIPPGETGWTVLRQKEEDGSCVFLGEDNMCGVYEARPLQCSTYPFWPRIMASRESWDGEVRSEGDGKERGGKIEEDKYWSVEKGGCEGMNRIPTNLAGAVDSSKGDGVSPTEAAERLATYKRYKVRYPTAELQPVSGRLEAIDTAE